MKRISFLVVLIMSFVACGQKKLSLEYLQKAKWNSLTQGVDYISTEDKKDIASNGDSIELKIRGVSGNEIDPIEMSFNKISAGLNQAISSVLKLYLRGSKAGYLKINFPDMIRSAMFTGKIYLRGDYSTPFSFTSDSTALKGIPGIRSARFISKEEAKQEFMVDGNPDWNGVLDANPLPNCIEIELDKNDWTQESLNELKNAILDKLMMASDIIFPSSLLKKSDDYYFFEYKRK